MGIIKKLLAQLFYLLVSVSAFWTLLLFLDVKEGLIAWVLASILAGTVAAVIIYAYIKSETHPYGMQISLWLNLASLLSFFVLSFVLFGGNMLLYEAEEYTTEKTNLTAKQKLSYYQQFIWDKQDVNLEELEQARHEGITFYYEKGSYPTEEIEQILSYIEGKKQFLERDLGGKTDAAVSIVLYGDSMEMAERESIQQQYSGFYDESEKTIHLPLPVDQTTLAHEYTHHLFLNIARQRGIYTSDIPSWFVEGVATHLSEKETSLSRTMMEDTEYVGFQDLETPGQWENHLQAPYSPYFQSGSFMRYLAAQEGPDILSRIFGEMRHSSVQESFEKVTGKTVQAHEANFIAAHYNLLKQWREADDLDVRHDEPQQSLELFLEIAASTPELESVNHRIANLYMETGEFEKAIPYRQKELELAIAENRDSLSAAYSYLAESLLFTDLPKAVEMAEVALDVSTEDEVFWSEGVLNELSTLEKRIASGEPLAAYIEILNGEYTINKGLPNYSEKIALIDQALRKYPAGMPAEQKALINLRQELENKMHADSQEQLASD